MNIPTLIILFVLLIFLLALLMMVFFKSLKNKKITTHKNNKAKPLSLEELRDRLKDKELSTQELKNTLDTVIQEYGVIESFELYMDIIFRMARHKNITKELIFSFEKDLSKLNPNHASSISDKIMDGLSLR